MTRSARIEPQPPALSARLTTIFEGTSEIRRRVVSDRMLPRP